MGYVFNYLSSIHDFQNESVMTVTDTSARLVEVLVDATELEKYNGVL
jgi:hypothetical protein